MYIERSSIVIVGNGELCVGIHVLSRVFPWSESDKIVCM